MKGSEPAIQTVGTALRDPFLAAITVNHFSAKNEWLSRTAEVAKCFLVRQISANLATSDFSRTMKKEHSLVSATGSVSVIRCKGVRVTTGSPSVHEQISVFVLTVRGGTILQAGRSRVPFPITSFDFSIDLLLRLTQPLTEMSTRNLPGGKGPPAGA
jgi:hypothetical protein